MEGPPQEPYFIALIFKGQLIMGPTKKMVVSYMIGDLVLLD